MSRYVPGSLPGFLSGTNAHLRASATGGPKMKPRASKPAERAQKYLWVGGWVGGWGKK